MVTTSVAGKKLTMVLSIWQNIVGCTSGGMKLIINASRLD